MEAEAQIGSLKPNTGTPDKVPVKMALPQMTLVVVKTTDDYAPLRVQAAIFRTSCRNMAVWRSRVGCMSDSPPLVMTSTSPYVFRVPGTQKFVRWLKPLAVPDDVSRSDNMRLILSKLDRTDSFSGSQYERLC